MEKHRFKTLDLAYIGMIAALCVAGTYIRIDFGPGAGMVHLGSAVIFTLGAVFGGVYGAVGAAIGSAVFDIIGGHLEYTVWAFFLKGLSGLLVGVLVTGLWPKPRVWDQTGVKRLLRWFIVAGAAVAVAVAAFIAWFSLDRIWEGAALPALLTVILWFVLAAAVLSVAFLIYLSIKAGRDNADYAGMGRWIYTFRVFFASIIAMVFNAVGWFFAWWQVLGNMQNAVLNIPFSLITSVVGIVVAVVAAPVLRIALDKSPVFKR